MPSTSRVAFEIGDEKTPVVERGAVGEGFCARSLTHHKRTSTENGRSESESVSQILVADTISHLLLLVFSVYSNLVLGFSSGISGEASVQRSRYYCSQCVKTLFERYFE